MKRITGLKDLLHDAVENTTDLVERTHAAAVARPARVLERLGLPAGPLRSVSQLQQALSGLVYSSIRAGNRAVQLASDLALTAVAPEAPAAPPAVPAPAWSDVAVGALNGVFGDLLARTNNGLAQEMSLFENGLPLPVEKAALGARAGSGPKVCIFVHGLVCTELEWSRGAEQLHGEAGLNFGRLLQRDLGFDPLFLRYNSGLHISHNGAQLEALLGRLVENYPVPIEQLVLVGHSMGGLVSRSAAQLGGTHGSAWTRRLTHLICLGTPHQGSPVEKGANLATALLGAIDTSATQVLSEVLAARSEGIKDLRYGSTSDADWLGRDPDALLEDHRKEVPMLDSVTYCFLAGGLAKDPAHPLGQLVGDALVRLPSALGEAPEPARRIRFQLGHQLPGLNHIELQNHPDVYRVIHQWLAPR